MFCVSVNMPLKPVTINVVCALICYCMDVHLFKPQYICGLIAGIQFNKNCYELSFPSVFQNPTIELLLKGISKVSPPIPDSRRPLLFLFYIKWYRPLEMGFFSPYIDTPFRVYSH